MIKERTTITDEDTILMYLTGKIDSLPESIEKKRMQFEYILVQMLEHRPDKQIVDLVMKVFGIKKTRAYELIQKAKYVHGSFFTIDKQFEIYRQQQDIERAIKWALEKQDLNAYVKAVEAKNKMLALIPDKTDLPTDKLGDRNYIMLLQLASGEALQVNMNSVIKMNEDEKHQLIKQIDDGTEDAVYEIMEEDVRKRAGA